MSFENVVLAYQHPYIAIYLEDNTIYNEESAEVIETRDWNGIQVGFFESGRDNTMLYCTTTQAFINEFGKPNFKLYGQPAYNVVNALDTDACGMYVLRLTADDATYANIVIMARFKVAEKSTTTDNQKGTETKENDGSDTTLTEGTAVGDVVEGPTEATKQLAISFKAVSIPEMTTVEDLKLAIAGLYSEDKDEEGYYNMPLMAFWNLGRGTCGNKPRLKFVDAVDYNDEISDLRTYCLNVMENEDAGLTIKEYIYGTFDQDAFDSTLEYGPSLYIEDLVVDPENGSNKIGMEFNPVTWNFIVNLYNNEVADEESKKTIRTLDVIFGKNMDGTTDENILFEDTADSVNLISVDGFSMASGDDGILGKNDASAEEAKTQLLINAFRGEIDPLIKSRFSTPADFMLDANFPDEVKREMAGFANKRMYDCMTYLDSGLISTTQGLINWLTTMKNVYAYNLVKELHCYKYRDTKYTGKIVPMTITHWIAKALPEHMNIYKLTLPFARESARLSAPNDFVSNSFRPIIDPDSNDIKKEIYKLRGNCYETVRFNVYQRSTAITTCQENSDRLDEFSEYVLHSAVRIAYNILNSNLYKFGEADDRKKYQKEAEDIILSSLSSVLRSVSVEFVMTQNDERKSIMRLRLRLVFKTIIKRGIIEVYLDPRVSQNTNTN